MEHYQKHRAQYPRAVFETRVLPPVDGVPRLFTLSSWYWEKLDILTRSDPESLEDITRFCLDIARKRLAQKPDMDFEDTFYQSFMYYIYGGYYRLRQWRENIANDFWAPVD